MTRLILFSLLIAVLMGGCSLFRGSSGPPVGSPPPSDDIAIDPVVAWDAVTALCSGVTVAGITYNVYVMDGPGPIPTVPSDPTLIDSCGPGERVDTAAITAENTAPITGTMFNVLRGEGTYTFAVEAVTSAGGRSYISQQITRTVVDSPNVTPSLTVTWNKQTGELEVN